MGPPIVVRHGDLKIWSHDPNQLQGIVAALDRGKVSTLPVDRIFALGSELLDDLCNVGVKGHASMASVARALRGLGHASLANRINKINQAASALRQVTTAALDSMKQECIVALSASAPDDFGR